MPMYYKDKRTEICTETDEDDCTMIEDAFGKDMQVTSGRAAKGKDSTREISSQVKTTKIRPSIGATSVYLYRIYWWGTLRT